MSPACLPTPHQARFATIKVPPPCWFVINVQALRANDLELVIWACQEAPKDAIFDAEPPLLSQTVLLCLMQQVGLGLTWFRIAPR
jgi:hypothetical protein